MAKKKGAAERPKVNKTQMVRDYLRVQPDAMPKAVADALQEKGVTISPQIVSQIKYQLKLMSGHGGTAVWGRVRTEDLSADDLVKVKEFADQIGGQENLERALEILRKLV